MHYNTLYVPIVTFLLFSSFIQHWHKLSKPKTDSCTHYHMCEPYENVCAGAQCPMSAWACIFVHDDRVVKKLVHCLLWFWMWCGINFQCYKHIQAIVACTPIFCVLASVCVSARVSACMYGTHFICFIFMYDRMDFPLPLARSRFSKQQHSF